MLTKAFKEQWAAALESGKYTQGFGQLRDRDNHYCCLGVGVDLVAPTSWVKGDFGTWAAVVDGDTPRGGYLPKAVAAEIGLSPSDEQRLTNLNDDSRDGKWVNDFHVIAKHIRAMPTRD